MILGAWLGNPLGILLNSAINPIPDLLNSGIFIGILFFSSKHVFPPIWTMFPPVLNPLLPLILPISWIRKHFRHQYFFGLPKKISSRISQRVDLRMLNPVHVGTTSGKAILLTIIYHLLKLGWCDFFWQYNHAAKITLVGNSNFWFRFLGPPSKAEFRFCYWFQRFQSELIFEFSCWKIEKSEFWFQNLEFQKKWT